MPCCSCCRPARCSSPSTGRRRRRCRPTWRPCCAPRPTSWPRSIASSGLAGLAQQITRRIELPHARSDLLPAAGAQPPGRGRQSARHAAGRGRRRLRAPDRHTRARRPAVQAHRLRPHPVRRLVPAGGAGCRPPDRDAACHRARLRVGERPGAAARHRRRRADRHELPAPHRHHHAHQPRHHGGRSVGAHPGARHPRRDRPAGVEPQRHAEPHPAADGRPAPGLERHRPRPAHAARPPAPAPRGCARAGDHHRRLRRRDRRRHRGGRRASGNLLRPAAHRPGRGRRAEARLRRRRSFRPGEERRRGLPARRRGFRAHARLPDRGRHPASPATASCWRR